MLIIYSLRHNWRRQLNMPQITQRRQIYNPKFLYTHSVWFTMHFILHTLLSYTICCILHVNIFMWPRMCKSQINHTRTYAKGTRKGVKCRIVLSLLHIEIGQQFRPVHTHAVVHLFYVFLLCSACSWNAILENCIVQLSRGKDSWYTGVYGQIRNI